MHEEHGTATEVGGRLMTEYGDVEEIVQTGREKDSLDVRLIQAPGLECFTRSDSPLCKHNLTVSKKKSDPKFNYLGTAPHSRVLSHPWPRCSAFQKHKQSSRLALHSISSH